MEHGRILKSDIAQPDGSGAGAIDEPWAVRDRALVVSDPPSGSVAVDRAGAGDLDIVLRRDRDEMRWACVVRITRHRYGLEDPAAVDLKVDFAGERDRPGEEGARGHFDGSSAGAAGGADGALNLSGIIRRRGARAVGRDVENSAGDHRQGRRAQQPARFECVERASIA